MRVVHYSSLDAAARRQLIERPDTSRAMFDPELRSQIEQLVDSVEARGDAAVADALAKYDGVTLNGPALLGPEQIAKAAATVAPEVRSAIKVAVRSSLEFNWALMPEPLWRRELQPGLEVGEKITAIESAGLFVPSGKGSFPSVLVQIGTPASVAGVQRLVVIVPPLPGGGGQVDPAVLAVAQELGIEQVLCANGPAGVAALALGTETIDPVVKIVGPGSPPVAAAMLECQRRGCVTQMVLGPTESAIIADGSADLDLLAADLLNEAEHGPDSSAFLITPTVELVDALRERVESRLADLPEQRAEWARIAIANNGGVVIVKDLSEAAQLLNAIAPEHAQLAVADPEALLEQVTNAGEVLLGQSSSFSLANYTIGVPASLPTGRFARVSSGITAETFLKRTSIAKLSAEANESLTDAALALAEHEDFPAHAAALRARRRS